MNDEKFMEFMTENFGTIKIGITELKTNVTELKTDMKNVKNTTVTKEFFTDKILELKKEIIVKLKKQDAKFDLLVEILIERKVIKKEDARKIEELTISATF